MQLLTGQAFETSGTVEVFGQHPRENADVLSRVCFVRESQQYPDNFKVKHALLAAEIVFSHWDAAFAAELLSDFGLPGNRKIKKLSRGMLSAVGVIIGLASRAPLTFFDEPHVGLDAVARQLFYDRLLADYAEHPRTVVLSTHLIDDQRPHRARRGDRQGAGPHRRGRRDAAQRGRHRHGSGRGGRGFVAGREVLHREQLGSFLRVTVAGAPQRSDVCGLEFEPVSLQQLVVRATQHNGRPVGAGAAEGGIR